MGPGGCYPMCWPAEGWISSLAPHGRFNTLNAVDIATRGVNGQPVYATHDGTAVCAWDNTGYGILAIVTSDCIDNFRSFYGHFESCAIPEGVEVPVRAGDMLGYLDSTGNSTGPHLHYEIKDGDPSYSTIYNYIPPYDGSYNYGDPTEGCFAKDSGGGSTPPTP